MKAWRHYWQIARLAFLVLAGTASCLRSPAPDTTEAPSLRLVPCHVEQLAEEVLCGVLEVFENRDAAAGRRIPIHVAVLPALRRDALADPVVVLAGGPGQGARSYSPLIARVFRDIRRTRDVVLVDLRGTGSSRPLNCPSEPGTGNGAATLDVDYVRACLAALDADPRHYAHRDALADLDDLRRLLGYERVNLWAGSWGTRAALLYTSAHPAVVRTVVLDGAVPPSIPFPDSTDTDSRRALALVFDACDADPGCRSAFPEIRAALTELVSRLEREPIATSIDHPRTGARQHVEVDADTFGAYVRVLLYSPADSALLPSVIMRTAAGDLRPLAALAARAASWSTETMALGTTLSVLCTEDVAPEQPAHLVAPRHLSFLARAYVGTWYRACREWPRGRRPAIEPGAPLPVPALVLSGGLDPATPPRWGEAMAKHFHPSLHAVAPEAGHNVSFTGCAPELIARFIDAGTTDSVDASCLAAIRRPPFALSFAGSRP